MVVWHVTMSLDGFIAGPGDAMDWVLRYVALDDPVAAETMRTTGAVLSGRRSYDVGRKPDQRPEFQEVQGGTWSGPVFVLTHHPPEDPSVTFLSGDIRQAVATAARAAGGRDVLVIGAGVARQCVEAGLVDEVRVHLAPLLLGDGVRLFARPGAGPVELETLEVGRSGQVANLRFRVVR
jgi:dihydrofolate reductase